MTGARLAALMIVLGSAFPAFAQSGLNSVDFFRALRERQTNKAVELLKSRPGLLNLRDEMGETALLITVARRDSDWVGFLLGKGADPNIAARNGDTPLIAAARIGYLDAAEELIRRKAKVDAANRMGETALIIAVQQRQLPLVKLLLNAGADPDKTDSAAGLSARDYAKRDSRAKEMLAAIEGSAKTAASKKPMSDLKDFTGFEIK